MVCPLHELAVRCAGGPSRRRFSPCWRSSAPSGTDVDWCEGQPHCRLALLAYTALNRRFKRSASRRSTNWSPVCCKRCSRPHWSLTPVGARPRGLANAVVVRASSRSWRHRCIALAQVRSRRACTRAVTVADRASCMAVLQRVASPIASSVRLRAPRRLPRRAASRIASPVPTRRAV